MCRKSTRYTTLMPRPNEKICQHLCTVFLLLLIITDGIFVSSDIVDYPLVRTKWGNIYGKWSNTIRGQPVANFLGIPYALPPIGDLRFKSPQPWNRSWSTDYNGTFDREKCVQLNKVREIVGNENCLHLNIFVPGMQILDEPREKRLPVFVTVHGGGYYSGNSNSKEYGPDYLLDQNVILVTMNYRLDVLGFFSTGNEISPGNYGLKDIKLALEWIQENIHSFQGNNESVTVAGFSAGAAATHLLALTHKTEGLFHRYILHSGSALSSWTFHPRRTYRQLCLELARRVGCLPKSNDDASTSNETPVNIYSAKDDNEMMKCMRRIDAREIIEMGNSFHVWRGNPSCVFGPTLEHDSDDAVITMNPWQTIKAGLFRDIPAIMQVVKDDGLIKTFFITNNTDIRNEAMENFERYLPSILETEEETITDINGFVKSIEDFYFDGNLTLNFDNIQQLATDYIIIWPIYESVRYQSKLGNSNIYLSFFAYEGTFVSMPKHVSHGDDINYLFPWMRARYQNRTFHNTENDITMINVMTEMWANFAKKGVPTAWGTSAWPDYRDHYKFMRFGIGISPDIVVQTDFLSDRMEFWEKLTARMPLKWMEHDPFECNLPMNGIAGADAAGCELTFCLLSLVITFFLART